MVHPHETHHRQQPSQGRNEGRNEGRVVNRPLLNFGTIADESEVFLAPKQSDEVDDLPMRPFGSSQDEMPAVGKKRKVSSDPRHEAWNV